MLANEEKNPLLWKITIKHKSDTGLNLFLKQICALDIT